MRPRTNRTIGRVSRRWPAVPAALVPVVLVWAVAWAAMAVSAAAAASPAGTGGAAAAGGGPAALDPAAVKTYQSLFGAEEKRVTTTSSTRDDAQFAASLMEKAKSLTDDPALVEVVYTKAYEFGVKDPEGYALAIEAARQMAERQKFRKA